MRLERDETGRRTAKQVRERKKEWNQDGQRGGDNWKWPSEIKDVSKRNVLTSPFYYSIWDTFWGCKTTKPLQATPYLQYVHPTHPKLHLTY